MKILMENELNALFLALRYEVVGDDFSCEENFSFKNVDLSLLYNLSKGYDLAHIVADALDKKGLLDGNEEVKKLFIKERNMAIVRYEQRSYEYGEIQKAFIENEIPFFPLKGVVIQDLYPKKWMRTSCDIDVLVKEDHLNLAVQVLKEKLNYTLDKISKHDAQLISPSGVHLELHYSLLDGEMKSKHFDLFEKVWEFDANNQSFERRMADEFFYGYFILHMARHVKEGGCGIKPFLDALLILEKANLNKEKCYEFLSKIELLAFAKEVESLLAVWFKDKKPTKLDKEFANFVILGGLYGTMENRVYVQTKRKKGKARLVMSRIFLPYEQLKFQYPIVQKHKILVPFYQVRRWFNLLNKNKRKLAKKEFETTISQNAKRGEKIEKLLKQLELK